MTVPRILIPTLFDEAWDSVLIATYGADLEFFERVLLRQLNRSRNRVVFCDGRQMAQKFANPDGRAQLRQLNRTYVLAPIWTGGAAHAKVIMLLSQDRGLLAVGSGNLSMNGYASQGECFSRYTWSEDDQGQLGEFLAARSFFDQVCGHGLVDRAVREFVNQAWQEAPWLYGKTHANPRVCHNLVHPLLDQFVEMVGGRSVDELVVHAPFYDYRCQALQEVIDRTSPKAVKVLLQKGLTSVDPEQLGSVLDRTTGTVDVRSVEPVEQGTSLHAKFLIARCGSVEVCLQGSPNVSSPALLHSHPRGNIEVANLLVGGQNDFDHLVTSLDVSPDHVEVSQLGLGMASIGDQVQETSMRQAVAEFTWVPPELSGVFDREVRVPPQLIVGGSAVAEVGWDIHEPVAGKTRFTVTLGEATAVKLNRVAAVNFVFEEGDEALPAFPYHLKVLRALTSGQGRTDLLKQAGDFDIPDEELEELLAQLDEALVVDGRSLWRMLKRKVPDATEDQGAVSMAYADLDWDAIRSHPKLAQYRNWDQHSSSDPTALEIILTSIAKRFEGTQSIGLPGEPEGGDVILPSDSFDDLGKLFEAEEEEAAEEEDLARQRRQATARSRAKRRFHSFVKRFVGGLTDEEFIGYVGPSVIVPSYVIFNHLCWRLIKIDLADPLKLIDAQTTLWRFFWGDEDRAGYFSTLSTGEQEAALDILERHHSEAVLLCSIFQAYKHTSHGKDSRAMVEVRDAWRTILIHPMFQPTETAVRQSANQLQTECESELQLTKTLDRLASHVFDIEPLATIGYALGCRPEQVILDSGRVSRGPLGEQVVVIHAIEDLDTPLTPESAVHSFSTLAALNPEVDYIRLEDRSNNVIAFADYERSIFIYANRSTREYESLDSPAIETPLWRTSLARLHTMAE